MDTLPDEIECWTALERFDFRDNVNVSELPGMWGSTLKC
jgi:hypothetical protein